MNNAWSANGQGFWTFTPSTDPTRANLRIDLSRRFAHPVTPLLYGKFCEHLGANIYGGMEAQILQNPTFGRWLFSVGDDQKYGGWQPEYDAARIREQVRHYITRRRLPDVDRYIEAFDDGGAMGWLRTGGRDQVQLSPDISPRGGRAQRIEPLNAGQGIAQWTFLPLHRTRGYDYRIIARSPEANTIRLAIESHAGQVLAAGELPLTDEWSTLTGHLELPSGLDPQAVYRVSITSLSAANLVLARVLLYPDDHVGHADPEIIALLKEARLPLLRWPGGNFVSGWDWHDSIGPIDHRPTRPNPAWGGLEYNLFGTDEFIQFCRAVGCEPMICINAGSDTPESAADWVQYCNGPANTPMGKRRAAAGHPEPYGVKYWEVGNELWGRWQVGWTTPAGMADRHCQFAHAMLKADPAIALIGCGRPEWPGNAWDQTLFAKTAGLLRINSDHILSGGAVTQDDTAADVYHAYMGQAYAIGQEYAQMRRAMEAAGITEARNCITELQIFPWYKGDAPKENEPHKLSPRDLPRPNTISEALYATTMIHESIRLGEFMELITHSATVNHGGGLSKAFARTFAHPVHYAHVLGSSLMNATPVAVDLTCATFSTHRAYDRIPQFQAIPALDAMAAVSADGKSLVLMIIHRGAETGPMTANLDLGVQAQTCEVTTLAGSSPADHNTSDDPARITPKTTTAAIENGSVTLTLPPYSLTRVVVPL